MRYERSLAIANRHDRLIDLIRSGEFSSPDLATKLKVSEQTIYRDIDFLKQRGYSIRSEKHADGWAYHLLAEPATVSNGKGAAG
ncbi:MAG: HTH domain-containing protein [Planctomycetaceae bacterium]